MKKKEIAKSFKFVLKLNNKLREFTDSQSQLRHYKNVVRVCGENKLPWKNTVSV